MTYIHVHTYRLQLQLQLQLLCIHEMSGQKTDVK